MRAPRAPSSGAAPLSPSLRPYGLGHTVTLPVRSAHASNVWPVVSPCCRTARPSRRARAMLRCPLCLSRRSHSFSSPLSSHPLILHRARALSLPVVPVAAPATLAMSVPRTLPATVAVATGLAACVPGPYTARFAFSVFLVSRRSRLTAPFPRCRSTGHSPRGSVADVSFRCRAPTMGAQPCVVQRASAPRCWCARCAAPVLAPRRRPPAREALAAARRASDALTVPPRRAPWRARGRRPRRALPPS